MSQLIIRKSEPADAKLIAEFSRKTFIDSFARHNTEANMEKFMREQFGMEQLIGEVNDPDNLFLLGMVDQQVAGYVKLKEGPNPEGLGSGSSIEIARIYTATGMIGKGIGSRLLQVSLEQAAERKKELIWLGVWEHNLDAIRFYKRWGFEIFGSHEFILGDDHQTDWMMKRKVSN